jgi:hypothetical protein
LTFAFGGENSSSMKRFTLARLFSDIMSIKQYENSLFDNSSLVLREFSPGFLELMLWPVAPKTLSDDGGRDFFLSALAAKGKK